MNFKKLFHRKENWESGTAVFEENVLGEGGSFSREPLVEKRSATRVSMSIPIRYRLLENGAYWKEGETQNLSNNGVRLAIPTTVSVGSWIEIEIQLPDAPKPVRLKGKVACCLPSFSAGLTLCGVAFEDLRKVSQKDRLIHFIADKLCTLTLQSTSSLVCRPAESLEEIRQACRLLYQEYLARGYCEPDPSQMHYSFFCVLPETRIFILKRESQVVGTIALILDSPCGLPLEPLFPKEIAALRKPGRRLAEVGLLALDLKTVGKNLFSLGNFRKQACLFRLFKMMFDYARFAGMTDLVIGMHPKHATLYRYLTFKEIGPVRSYPGACGKPALPMWMDMEDTLKTVSTAYGKGAFFLKETAPRQTLEKHPSWTLGAVREFLIETRPLWEKLSPKVQEYLRTCYPGLGNGL